MTDQRNSTTPIDPVKLDRLAEVAVKVRVQPQVVEHPAAAPEAPDAVVAPCSASVVDMLAQEAPDGGPMLVVNRERLAGLAGHTRRACRKLKQLAPIRGGVVRRGEGARVRTNRHVSTRLHRLAGCIPNGH